MATRWLVRTTLGILLSIGVATTALAQYGGGGTTGGTGGNYSTSGERYGSGTAIGIAAGAAAAVALGIFAGRPHHANQGEGAAVVGWPRQANGVTTLGDDSTK